MGLASDETLRDLFGTAPATVRVTSGFSAGEALPTKQLGAGAVGGASITAPITTAVTIASLLSPAPGVVLGFALSIPGAGHPVTVGDSAGHGITLTPNGTDVLTWEAPPWMTDLTTVYVVATGGTQAVGIVWGVA